MKRVACLLFGVNLLLVGCGDNGAVRSEALVAEHYVAHVQHYTKPGASIALVNDQVTLDVAGAEYVVNVGVISGYSLGQMGVSISSSDGLHIVSGDLLVEMNLHQGALDIPLNVMAEAPGRYYIYINALVDSEGLAASRALTFIVQVGEAAKVESQAASQKSAGQTESFIRMQAKEEVIQ